VDLTKSARNGSEPLAQRTGQKLLAGIKSEWKESFRVKFEPDDYLKRGYLLPKGCKDLIDLVDALKPEPQLEPKYQTTQPAPLPPVIGEITVPAQASASQLATLLSQKPFQIVADLMPFGVFANVWQPLDFDTLSKVVRMYGFTPKRAAS
jgi:hypothetical protein